MGFAVFNEAHLTFENGDYRAQIATFIHEFLHGLYFHPALFEVFPKNKDGSSFMFKDSNNIWKLRGDKIMETAKSHYGCDSFDGGNAFFGLAE